MSFAQDAFVSIPVSTALYSEFARRFPGGVASVVEQVAQDFLDRTALDFEADEAAGGGMWWDGLFLPHGTQLGTRHLGQLKVGEVVDGEARYEGQSYASVNRLGLAMRGSATNAWRDLLVKRPTDKDFIAAGELRVKAPGKRTRVA